MPSSRSRYAPLQFSVGTWFCFGLLVLGCGNSSSSHQPSGTQFAPTHVSDAETATSATQEVESSARRGSSRVAGTARKSPDRLQAASVPTSVSSIAPSTVPGKSERHGRAGGSEQTRGIDDSTASSRAAVPEPGRADSLDSSGNTPPGSTPPGNTAPLNTSKSDPDENASVPRSPSLAASLPSSPGSSTGTTAHRTEDEGAPVSVDNSTAQFAPPVASQPPEVAVPPAVLSEESAVTGEMKILFHTRENGEQEGVSDDYVVNLKVLDRYSVRGQLKRQTQVLSRFLRRETQKPGFSYDLKISAASGAAPDLHWSGFFETPPDGNAKLRTLVAVSKGVSTPFGGTIRGKGTGSSTVRESVGNYLRIIRGKKITLTARKVDPVEFQNVVVPDGPGVQFPETRISGHLDYDYDTGNWLTNGLRFEYTEDGVPRSDLVTGSIHWQEDPNRATNGRGMYLFNLRWNEADVSKSDESAAFSEESTDEGAFFAEERDIPALVGKISYIDSFGGSKQGDEPTVVASTVQYSLIARGLRKTQVMNMIKAWLLIAGPVNDE